MQSEKLSQIRFLNKESSCSGDSIYFYNELLPFCFSCPKTALSHIVDIAFTEVQKFAYASLKIFFKRKVSSVAKTLAELMYIGTIPSARWFHYNTVYLVTHRVRWSLLS